MGCNLDSWLSAFSTGSCVRYAKRLSGNDTLANKTHQAGPYIPKEVLFEIFPDLENREIKNPDILFRIAVDSHDDQRTARAIWYNNRLTGGTRNETRITGFGGKDSALLDPENTGALVLFNFRKVFQPDEIPCRIWVCRNPEEEELAEAHTGVVEPGKWVLHRPEGAIPTAPSVAGHALRAMSYASIAALALLISHVSRALPAGAQAAPLLPRLRGPRAPAHMIARRALTSETRRHVRRRTCAGTA